MPNELIPVLTLAAGVLLGAWISHRARNNTSPLPSLPKLGKPVVEEGTKKLPVCKP